MTTALVTGATAGIGAAFVRALAAQGHELVLVARDEQRLRAAADALPGATWIAADLGTAEGCARVEARCAEGVDVLVNNAGLGMRASFDATDVADEDHLLAVNVRAVLRLTHAALPAMLARGAGSVINVSSVAGSTPGARGASYSASKAYVTTLSEALHQQYGPQGVKVLALCPGFTRTEFHERAEMDVTGVPGALWSSADDVVRVALADLARGRAVSIPGLPYKVVVTGTRLLPSRLRYALTTRVSTRLPD